MNLTSVSRAPSVHSYGGAPHEMRAPSPHTVGNSQTSSQGPAIKSAQQSSYVTSTSSLIEPPINRLVSKTLQNNRFEQLYGFMGIASDGRDSLVATNPAKRSVLGASSQPALLLAVNCEFFNVGPRLLGRLILVAPSPMSLMNVFPGQGLVLCDRLFEPVVVLPCLTRQYPVREEHLSQPILSFVDVQVDLSMFLFVM
jgi:hypothetical protein